jgi:hypothetical protein
MHVELRIVGRPRVRGVTGTSDLGGVGRAALAALAGVLVTEDARIAALAVTKRFARGATRSDDRDGAPRLDTYCVVRRHGCHRLSR